MEAPLSPSGDETTEAGMAGAGSGSGVTEAVTKTAAVDEGFESFPQSNSLELDVRVTSPEKHGDGYDAYVSYCVTTKTSMPTFKDGEFYVRRRYKDFLWLRGRLEESVPGCVVPPMPEKHILKHLNRFSDEFTERRRHLLECFLRRVAEHPLMSQSEDFHKFLEAPAHELTTARKRSGTILDSWADSVKNYASKMILRAPDDRFLKLNIYVAQFNTHMAAMEAVSNRLVKELGDLAVDVHDFGPVFSAIANSEEGMLCHALTAVANDLERVSESIKGTSEAMAVELSVALHEYLLYGQALQVVLRRRDVMQLNVELAMEELDRKRADRDATLGSDGKVSIGTLMGKDPSVVKDQKLERLAKEIQDLEVQVEKASDVHNKVNEALLEDVQHWHARKKRDFKQIFQRHADAQIAMHKGNLELWEGMLRQVNRIPATCGLNRMVGSGKGGKGSEGGES